MKSYAIFGLVGSEAEIALSAVLYLVKVIHSSLTALLIGNILYLTRNKSFTNCPCLRRSIVGKVFLKGPKSGWVTAVL